MRINMKAAGATVLSVGMLTAVSSPAFANSTGSTDEGDTTVVTSG